MYKEALRTGFYELQSTRDWYREVTADVGMHAGLIKYWIKTAALLVAPIAPHFAEHLWTDLLKEPKSIQLALWPETSAPVERTVIDSAGYMRSTLKSIRDAEISMSKKGGKGAKMKGMAFDPAKPKAVRVFVATKYPDWQETCIEILKGATDMNTGVVDDAKVREEITKKGLIKDKKTMPFVMNIKVCASPEPERNAAVLTNTEIDVETHQRIRRCRRTQPHPPILGEGSIGDHPALPEAKPELCRGRGSFGGRRQGQGGTRIYPCYHRDC